jgi:hypothetical protein
MAIGDDFSIATSGDIRHVSGSTTYTVLELHRWLQDLADDAQASGNDYMDITTQTPSERSTNNIITLNSPYNIDDTAAEYLYDGSIEQLGGDTIYAGLVVVGAVETGTELQVTQDETIYTSFWSTGLNSVGSILNRVLIKVRDQGASIDGQRIRVWARELGDTYAEFEVTMALGNNTAAIFTSADLNNVNDATTISGWSDITNTEGYQQYDLNADASVEDWYSRWDYGSRTAAQVYERTKWIQRRGTAETIHGMSGALFRGITHQWAYNGQTTNFVEDNIVVWGVHCTYTGQTTNFTLGEYLSFSGGAVGKLVWQDDAGATGSIVVMVEGSPPTSILTTETITGLSSGGDGTVGTVTDDQQTGGSAVILADDDNGATGTLWVQLISGTVPATTFTLYERGVAATDKGAVNGAVTTRTVKPEFIGTYTGSAFIGAFGIGVDPTDGIAADQFFDLTNTLRQPPNNQTFTVFGLISGDRVLVTNNNATNIDFTQRTLNTSLTGASEATCVVTVAIPSDTPSTGWVRVETDGGRYHWAPYSSWTGSTFTFTSAENFSTDNATAPKNVFIGYIDLATATTEESFTATYSSDRTMFVRVRDGGASPIKTFETTATFGSGGGSATAIRTSDA